MKSIKTILGIVLATAGFGGAVSVGAAAAVNSQNNQTRVVEAATSTRIYLDMSSFSNWYSSSASFKVHTWNSANGDQYHAVTKVADAYYYADVDLATYASGGGYRFTRYDSTGGTEWNRGEWQSYTASKGTYYKPTDWTAGTWTEDDQKTWTIIGATNGVWAGGDEDINISLEMRFNNEGLSFYNTNVNLSANSVFKIKNSDGTYYGYNAIETGAGSVIDTGDVSGNGTSNISVVNSGSYEVYMKPFSGKFWMQENSEKTATSWASSFLTATGSICSSGGESANHESALSSIWNSQKTAFEALTQGAKDIIKAGNANSTVKDAHDRYVHIMTRYSSLDEFGDWEVSAARLINPINNNSATIFVVVASIAILTFVGVGGYFFIRKKKEQ